MSAFRPMLTTDWLPRCSSSAALMSSSRALIGSCQNGVHLDVEHFLFVRRQCVRDVFEGHKGAEFHQKPAEKQRRGSRAPAHSCSYLGFVRAGIVGWTDCCDFLENPIGFRECPHTGLAVCEPFFEHLLVG